MEGKDIKVLMLHTGYNRFVTKDIDILKEMYDVRDIEISSFHDIVLEFPKIARDMVWCDIVFSWFATYHALIATVLNILLNKKSVVVAGGYDVSNEKYPGKPIPMPRRLFVGFVLNRADVILAVSKYIYNDAKRYLDKKNLGKLKLAYHGFDPGMFSPKGKKEEIIITVGIENNKLWRKGTVDFARASALLTKHDFYLIGKCTERTRRYIKSVSSANLKIVGFVSGKELVEYMGRAKVYVQASSHEGFGLSLAEAMLCECVPVVTKKAAIPEVVGDAGYYAEYNNPKDIAEKIKMALKSGKGKPARERIKRLFPIENRKKEIWKAIDSLIAHKGV